ncbi:MAG: maleylacetoacetate isomerase [Alphaproteobacteria bacterium]
MRLYSQSRNSAGWRVRIALALKRVDYQYVAVGSLAPGEYRRINPQGLMPALEIDGRIVAQSGAILELIEERHPDPPLLPRDPVARAECRAFAGLIAADLHPINNNRIRKYLAGAMGRPPAQLDAWYRHWVAVGLASLEETLARRGGPRPFCFGAAATIADLHLVPQLYNARRFGCDLRPYPMLVAAETACRGVDAFRASAPERMPDHDGRDPPWA